MELPSGVAYRLAWRDISERRAVEQLQREFIAMINHDLLNPITAIGLHAELLQFTQSYSAQAVDNILDAARRLERLVNDLLDVSRLETGRLRISRSRVDLAAVVQQCAEQVAITAPHHQVIAELDPTRAGLVGSDAARTGLPEPADERRHYLLGHHGAGSAV